MATRYIVLIAIGRKAETAVTARQGIGANLHLLYAMSLCRGSITGAIGDQRSINVPADVSCDRKVILETVSVHANVVADSKYPCILETVTAFAIWTHALCFASLEP